MSRLPETLKRLTGRDVLKKLAAAYAAAMIALAGTIWFELPQWIATVLLVAALLLALTTAISAGRTIAAEHAALPWRKRPGFTGRGAGLLAFVVLTLLALACAWFVYPRSWPTRVEDAVARLSARLDAQEARKLAYMGAEDLALLQDTLGASIRDEFGLRTRNFRLAYDCDPEYINPYTCSSIIISRLWKKARADLPDAERRELERLEANMERLRLESKQFENVPIEELTAYFNDLIRAQFGSQTSFSVAHDPARTGERLTVSWHASGTISLREALELLEQGGQWEVRKDPPRLVLERVEAASTTEPRE